MSNKDDQRITDIEVFGPNTPYSVIHDNDHKGYNPHSHPISDNKEHGKGRPLTSDEKAAYDSFKNDKKK